MKTNIKLKSIIITGCLVVLFSTGCVSQDKKSVDIKIRTSAICSQCKDRIEHGMAFEKGIKDIELDVGTKIATITYNPLKTTPADIRTAISKLGYDADTVKADKNAYAKLPPCCRKKDEPGSN